MPKAGSKTIFFLDSDPQLYVLLFPLSRNFFHNFIPFTLRLFYSASCLCCVFMHVRFLILHSYLPVPALGDAVDEGLLGEGARPVHRLPVVLRAPGRCTQSVGTASVHYTQA
jgi:hypothetical protein